MLKRILFCLCMTMTWKHVGAQYFQFSQYNFTQQRINPATVAASDYASVGAIFRDQATGGDFHLKSSMVSAVYPFSGGSSGTRFAGVGLSVMDDRTGGIFSTQEASASMAVNVFLNKYQSLSLGFKGLFLQRKINMDGLYTGSQFVADRGFDGSIFNGENLQFMQSKFFTFSSGVHWQDVDREGNRLGYWGISIFDFNNPEDSFSGVENHLNSTLVFTGGVRVYDNTKLALTPELLYTRNNGNNVVNLGAITSYDLKPVKDSPARIDIITKYVLGRSGILGLQFHRENFSIGCSYDFPVVTRNVGNTGAFEIGLELRRLVDPRLRKKADARKKPQAKPVAQSQKPKTPQVKPAVKKDSVTTSSTIKTVTKKPDFKTTLAHKQDSALAMAEAGNIKHQPLVLEKILLHFNFEFNSSDLDEKSKQYLDDLTEALLENEHLNIKLTGHTDNVGSAKFNHRLSVHRANSIKQYLVSKGVAQERIQADGKGMSEPLNGNKTEEDMALNRRVELLILYEN